MKKFYANKEKKQKKCTLIFSTVKGLSRYKKKFISCEENNYDFIHQEDGNIFEDENLNQEGGINE